MEFYYIYTYGCQMNVHESEKIAGMLEELGYKETKDVQQASIFVFNTCCIRKAAEQKAEGNIGALKQLKKKNPNIIIAVGGCMTQQENRAEELKNEFPFINIIFGTHNLYKFKEYLVEYKKEHKNRIDVWKQDNIMPEEYKSYRTSGYNAWVNISYGCNNYCTYCIVPYVRGRERSRPFDQIVEECRELVKEGYKSITLLGQNVNSYGNDLHDERYTFSKLLTEIANIEGDFVLKFMTSHPKDLSSEVIDTIRDNPKIARQIHLPVQSGSNEILKAMNRRYTVEKYKSLIDEIKQKIPNVSLSTDIIVGFPGETEEDFQKTVDLIKYVRYNNIFAFMYSKRSGTIAERMENQIPQTVKNQRVNFLLNLQKEIAKEDLPKIVGTIQRTLISHKKAGKVIGVTDCGKTIIIENTTDKTLRYESVLITKIEGNQIYGEIKR